MSVETLFRGKKENQVNCWEGGREDVIKICAGREIGGKKRRLRGEGGTGARLSENAVHGERDGRGGRHRSPVEKKNLQKREEEMESFSTPN